ncbi:MULTISPECIES: lipopolysaccharide core heptose(II) kinase RfaY [Cetobacterium]|jgi:heptose II phosphotransferase|uniref:Lipopolysaccharide core heptose(II) kinase RfaY n=1 Tax=Candidatus Cetobacterium colombiensis TaxID=3073100 RepID=A0ABU4W9Z8_9FUSO|nr:lipopolysaccharide core heptose(II) kinase RfaY [Candidatus Cetobacterium colombiensis]MDX8336360.1 lipopolysaccharide core heptose(II) kinase RfaY [Candidatus Cetobacterium colombiensis]
MEKVKCNDAIDFNLINKINDKNFKILKALKDDKRSKVLLIEINGNKYVYKIPLEKNKRGWQRIISVIRGSESKREFKNYSRIQKLGFKGPTPIMYWEKRKLGMAIDSFLVTSYVEGKSAKKEDLLLVEKELRKIHDKGYLHGDSQLSNFMVENNEIFLIDAKLMKNKYGKAGETYEFIYLEESCHENIDIYNKNNLSYKIAKSLNSYLHWIGKLKKTIRGKGR